MSFPAQRNLLVVAVASVIVIGLGLYDLSRERLPEGQLLTSLSGRQFYSWLRAKPATFLPGLPATDSPRFASDSTSQNDAIWALTGSPGQWIAREYTAKNPRVDQDERPPKSFGYRMGQRAELAYSGRIGNFDVARWGTSGANLFLLNSGQNVSVSRIPLQGSASKKEAIQVGTTPALPALDPQGRRSLVIAHHSGSLPDLYVIDSSRDDVWVVSVYTGESGFRKLIDLSRSTEVRSGRLRPDQWIADIIGGTRDTRAGLVLATQGLASGSNHVEIHALPADEDFQEFVVRIPTQLWGRPRPGHTFLFSSLFAPWDEYDLKVSLLDIFAKAGRIWVVPLEFRF